MVLKRIDGPSAVDNGESCSRKVVRRALDPEFGPVQPVRFTGSVSRSRSPHRVGGKASFLPLSSYLTTKTEHGAVFVRFWEVPPQIRPNALLWPMKPTTSRS
jgi:hypothetical protein